MFSLDYNTCVGNSIFNMVDHLLSDKFSFFTGAESCVNLTKNSDNKCCFIKIKHEDEIYKGCVELTGEQYDDIYKVKSDIKKGEFEMLGEKIKWLNDAKVKEIDCGGAHQKMWLSLLLIAFILYFL